MSAAAVVAFAFASFVVVVACIVLVSHRNVSFVIVVAGLLQAISSHNSVSAPFV